MNLAVIFDMDGVLIDSQPLHYELDVDVLRACGYPAELATVVPYTGLSNPDRWAKYKEDLNLSETVDRLVEMAEAAMRDVFSRADLKPIDGIPTLIDGIKAMGIKCGVASSSSHELIQLILGRIGILDKFDMIVSGEDVQHGKPAPDVYLKAAEKAGISPQMCIAIEDSSAGILAAKNAGFVCIAYKNPSTLGQDFTHANYVVTKYDDCFPIIQTLVLRAAMGSLQ